MRSRFSQQLSVLVVGAVAAVGLLAPTSASSYSTSDSVTLAASPRTWEASGPYAVTVRQGGPDHTLYYPSDIATSSRQHPVIIWGNGTGASVAEYDFALRHIASWGFIVAAANTGQSGSGEEMLAGARWVIAEDTRAGSVFHGKVNEAKVGASGHSQGGGGAIVTGADPLVDTTIPIQPGPQGSPASLRGPAFFVAGQYDWIVPSFYVRFRFSRATQVPAVFGELKGADHFFPGESRDRVKGAVVAWFRFWLMDDAAARSVFFGPATSCGMCTDTAWSAYDRNARANVITG